MHTNHKLEELLKHLEDNINNRKRYEQIIKQLEKQIFTEICQQDKDIESCQPEVCSESIAKQNEYRKLLQEVETKVNAIAEVKYSQSTEECFDEFISSARNLFVNKTKDYGPSWILLRWESLVDQLWIKASRIRTLQELQGEKLIQEDIDSEFIGIINYSVIALIKLWFEDQVPYTEGMLNGELVTVDKDVIAKLYDQVIFRIKELLVKKNHDYGEAWRSMATVSITDQIFVKLYRVKSILKNSRKLEVSEDIDAQFSDIINYAVFALIQLSAE